MAQQPLTVPEIRALGFHVYVQHLRRYRFVIESSPSEELLTRREAASRGIEVERGTDGRVILPVAGRWDLESKGGRTVAIVQRFPQGEVLAQGEAVTNLVDDYRRKTGLLKALGRAQGELERKGLLPPNAKKVAAEALEARPKAEAAD